MPKPLAKPHITDLTKRELVSWLEAQNIAPFRATQIFHWIFNAQTDDFSAMTNIKKEIRSLLAEHFTIGRLTVKTVETSRDGSKKYLFELADGNLIESVLIPGATHDTLCISSQVGCAQGCRFCLTAQSGFIRNLSAGEILAQVRDIRNTLPPDHPLTNIVLMGMGEPLANYENVTAALQTLTDSDAGLGFSPRRITLSTAGLVPKLTDLGRESQVNLAISLNATDNETRSALMPINRKYPIETLLAACRHYPLPPRRKLTFEYILIDGLNDSPVNAKQLATLLRPIKAKINLIPFNPHDGSDFKRPAEQTVFKFQKILQDADYTTIIRQSKGTDISAACGQLQAKASIRAKTA
ncbi:MAG: 23S rRNA (adenine(2503)-C(2))-methyltransferase RlmN [Pseudomonadota bacterium]